MESLFLQLGSGREVVLVERMRWEEEGIREEGGLCSHMQPHSETGSGNGEVGRGKRMTPSIPARRVDVGALWQTPAFMLAPSLTSCVTQGRWVCTSISFSLK